MADTRDVDLLEDVLSGELPADQAPASVSALATLATTLSSEVRAEAAPEDVRYRLRDGLIAAMDVPASPLDRARDRVDRLTARWRHSMRVAAASAVASTVIDLETVLIDGHMPETVRARLVDAVRARLGPDDFVGVARPAIGEGTIGVNARSLGAASLPLTEKFLI